MALTKADPLIILQDLRYLEYDIYALHGDAFLVER